MATLSSHVLDSLRGTHAAGIRCVLYRIDDKARVPVVDVGADAEGRISMALEFAAEAAEAEFELVLHAASYFADQGQHATGCVREVVLRFHAAQGGHYHLPVMLAPHSYSTWWSD